MPRHRLIRTLPALLPAALLLSCTGGGPPPRVPMPSEVPAAPQYSSADAIVDKLGTAGIPCRITLSHTMNGASTIDCTATLDGKSFDTEIKVYDPTRYTRDDIGDGIAAGRTTFHQTFVAAGNWRVNVVNPAYAPKIAQALGGVVLPGNEPDTPDRPLPSIPPTPHYDTLEHLADALDTAVGCQDRQPGPAETLTCTTGSKAGRSPNCATLQLHADDADRDRTLRTAIAHLGVPAYLVTAANWSVNLCDYALANEVAGKLHGVVVRYDGQ
ncbi:hypothetical protein [Kitasatospora cineracea]|uniref:Uncharacterized protein n=1 Tax=Kitasatospora cineracea TaxID=88074 RepID=A0A3N4S1I1_9ACTN|nr:hypothetical protein [Kitasatospora cineracea]RPE37181.1 hypothetical protein EDD38_5585 [Kitasatospora cineracea]